MLKMFCRYQDLDMGSLLEVYQQSIQENGAISYPNEEPGMQRLLAEQDFRDYLKEEFFRLSGACYAVWEQDGSYISALRLEPYRDGLLLEALETRSQRRRNGYAKKLLMAVLGALDGGPIYSHVEKKNEPSMRVHLACGFRQELDYAAYIDGSVSRKACTLKKVLP